MAPKPKVTRAQIIELMISHKMKPADVARALGVSRQVVSYHLKREAGTTQDWESPAAVAASKLPWDDVPADVVRNAAPYRLAREHMLYMDTAGEGMSDDQLTRLRLWYERLTEWSEVLEYDPRIEPYHGMKYGCFRYVAREKRDHDLILRVNEYTKLGKADKVIWRLPAREKWPAVE
jgi:hypothetical protein